MKISRKAELMPPSGIRAFFDLVLGMKDVISLGVGEPDFVTPWNVREAAIYALEEGYTSYTSNKGLLELRHDLARHLRTRHGLDYDPEEGMLITVGVSEAYDLAVRAVINPGDKVLIPEPSYVSYGPLIGLCGGVPVYLKTTLERGFKIRASDISKACDGRTKAMVLNYPSNPTGASYSRRELLEIARVVAQRRLTVISDEVYCELSYDFPHTPFPALPGMKEKTIYLNGFSKAYAMTGWRLGYACGPKEAIGAMTKIHQYSMLCASVMSQMAAREALKNCEKSVRDMKKEYRRRREYIVRELNEMGLTCHTPEGAFYAFPSIKSTGLGSVDFAERLLKSRKVAVIPGVAFGPSCESFLRISYASSMDNLREACARMRQFIQGGAK